MSAAVNNAVVTAGGKKEYHMDIQQQVITTGNGFKLNVIRLMQHEGAQHVDAIEQLQKVKDDAKVIETPGDGNDSETPNNDNSAGADGSKNTPQPGGDDVTVKETVRKVKVDMPEETIDQIIQEKNLPPQSIFNSLKPSEERYTFVKSRDEL